MVELLVVISIIALLIGILLPSLRKARDQGKLVKCLAHIRGVSQNAMMFAGERDGRVQIAASAGNVAAVDPGKERFIYGDNGEILAWPVALAQMVSRDYRNNWDWGVRAVNYTDAQTDEQHVDIDLELFACPADRVRLSSTFFPRHEPSMYGTGIVGVGDPNYPKSPANRMSYWGRLSYGINEDVAGADGADSDYWPSCWRPVQQSNGTWLACKGGVMYGPSSACFRGSGQRLRGVMDKIFAPGKVGLFFETGPESIEQAQNPTYSAQFANLINSADRDLGLSGPYFGDAQQTHPWRVPTKRHPDGKLNVAFADGHGETIRATSYAYNGEVRKDLPSAYTPRVRVSPYNPRGAADD
ncbi:MAG: hypothetical protein H6816_12045 [Phycisphaerales bacterium]|nr:hypothetical protein [Phycisphaerales bacterium]